MFQSIDELDKFSYNDCVIKAVTVRENTIALQVEALIVEPDNSQNTNYTRSYAGDAAITYTQGRICKVVKEGYRYYDANDVLQEEVPDTVLSEGEIMTLLSQLTDTYLYDIQMVKQEDVEASLIPAGGDMAASNSQDVKVCVLGIEFPPEDPNDLSLKTDSYQIMVAYDNVTVQWERYMNRVEG